MAKILGVNGILTDGSNSTDLMLRDLSDRCGYSTDDVPLPRVGFFPNPFASRSRRLQREHARILMKHYVPGDAVVAHSRGALVVLRAMEMGAKFSFVFLFAPAMNADFIIPAWGCKRMWVIFNPDDRAVKSGALLWFHDFGKAGLCGLNSAEFEDGRITNVHDTVDNASERLNHSNAFLDANRREWVRFIDKKLRLNAFNNYMLWGDNDEG